MLKIAKSLRNLAILAAVALSIPGISAIADDRQAGIETVITRQLEAFRRNDAAAAWAIAAPTIQQRFGTKDRFMDMVGNYYPQILNSKSAVFKGLREIGGDLVQRVFIEGGPGDFVDAYYTMKMIDGEWRITGVYVTKPKPEGV